MKMERNNNRKVLAVVLAAIAVILVAAAVVVVLRSGNSPAEETATTIDNTTLPYVESVIEPTEAPSDETTQQTTQATTESTTTTAPKKTEKSTTTTKPKTNTDPTQKPAEKKPQTKVTTTQKSIPKKTTTKKQEPTTLSAAEKNRQARAFAQKLAAEIDGETDLERVSQAAQIVAYYSSKATYTMEGSDYATAYGVFIKGEYSCAGSTRALGMLLECMGYSWKHVNENQYTHQWVELTMDGQKGWADGQIGWAGYGEYPYA